MSLSMSGWPTGSAALALLALSTPARAQAIDWNGYCSPSAKRVLLLVDITTPYDARDKQILVDGLQSIARDQVKWAPVNRPITRQQ